jgi:hypothetical protein
MSNNVVKLFCHNYVKRDIPISGGTEHLFFVRCSDYVKYAERCYEFVDVNPRKVKGYNAEDGIDNISKDTINTAIRETLAKSPEKFVSYNSGIEIIAENVGIEKDMFGTFIRFELNDKNKHGVVNGNHTQVILKSFQDKPCNELVEASPEELTDEELKKSAIDKLASAYVKVTVLEKVCDQSEISDIAAAKNRHHPIRESSLANLKGNFNTMKTALKQEGVCGDIIWKENDGGSVKVEKVVQYIMLFDVARYPNVSEYDFGLGRKIEQGEERIFKQPQGAYSSTSTIFNDFLDILSQNPEDYSGLTVEERKRKDAEIRVLKVLQENVFEILVLSDKVSMKIDRFKDIGRLGKEIGKEREESEIPLRFWKDGKTNSIKHKQATWDAFKMPFLSSLRANIDVKEMRDNGKLKWHVPIDELLEKVGNSIVSECYDKYGDSVKHFDFAKKSDIYKHCFNLVEKEILKRGINTDI